MTITDYFFFLAILMLIGAFLRMRILHSQEQWKKVTQRIKGRSEGGA